MQITVFPASVSGAIRANPSKSHAIRAIGMAALCREQSTISGIGESDDVLAALRLAAELGADVIPDGEPVRITGFKRPPVQTWHCGESGLCFRMFAALAALIAEEIILHAEGSLLKRPAGFIVESLKALGVHAETQNGFPPLKVRGPFTRKEAVIDGTTSSQLLTGLLMALPLRERDTRIEVPDLVSGPYIDLTIAALENFGIQITRPADHLFIIPGGQFYAPVQLDIEGDWSGMACMCVAGAIAGEVMISGLQSGSRQGDRVILDVLKGCGAVVREINENDIVVEHRPLKPFSFDAGDCPDLFPPLVALASHCDGESRIRGVRRLKTKESDRAASLMKEFSRLGVSVEVVDDEMIIHGSEIHGGGVFAHGDHRIAMTLATAALRATGPVTISGAECVSKSYPKFFEDLTSLGVNITRH